MKRIVAVIMLAVLALGCFTACSGGNGGETADAQKDWIYAYPKETKWTEIREDLQKRSDCVFVEGLECVNGYDVLTAFINEAEAGRPAALRYAQYFGQDMTGTAPFEVTRIYFGFLDYDGKRFTLTVRGNLDEKLRVDNESFAYFKHTPGAVSSGSKFKSCENFFLVNDDSLTYERISKFYTEEGAEQFPHAILFTLGFTDK